MHCWCAAAGIRAAAETELAEQHRAERAADDAGDRVAVGRGRQVRPGG